MFLDPDDPGVQAEAGRQGIPADWLDAARRSPVHALVARHRVPPPELARQIAWQQGQHLGSEARQQRQLGRPGTERTVAAAEDALDRQGYEPVQTEPVGWCCATARSTPWSAGATDLLCSINAAYVDGLLRGLGNDTVRAELAPAAGSCCVRILAPV